VKSVMRHSFSQVPSVNIPRTSFNRSHGHKTTFDAGYLVPVFWDYMLPGDSANLRMAHFTRMATPEFPFMDNLFMESFFFSVPYRLVWDNFQKFMGEQRNPGDSTDYLIPQVPAPTTTGFVNGSLYDYFGFPTMVDDYSANNLLGRAYNLIYNEWFRDQNLQNSVVVDVDDGPDVATDYVLLRRGKRHDYFTSCLPWPQKGPAVDIPLGTQAPIVGLGVNTRAYDSTASGNVWETDAVSATTYPFWKTVEGTIGGNHTLMVRGSAASNGNLMVYADLEDATAATINQLRQAFQIQKMYERDARGGTRYTEIIRAHFGVTSPDARLQRPEYLGGGSGRINVHPVAQTSETDSGTPQGNLAAFATASAANHGFTKGFTEHCVVLGFVCVRADLTYQQGLNREHSLRTRLEQYWPALAHLGEQAVLTKEIYLQGTVDDDIVFGYQERYAEKRYKPSYITGKFRSNDPQSLDHWTLTQDFGSRPTLSSAFIQEDPPIDRVIATPDEPQFLCDLYFDYIHARPMPMYGVPGNIDRF